MTRLSGLRNVAVSLGYTVLFGVLVVVLGPLLSGGAKADSVMGQVAPALVMASLGSLLPALLVGVLVGRLGSLGGGPPGWLVPGVLMGLVPVVLSFAVMRSYPHLPGVGWETYALSAGIVLRLCRFRAGADSRRLTPPAPLSLTPPKGRRRREKGGERQYFDRSARGNGEMWPQCVHA